MQKRRKWMVKHHLAARGIGDKHVLNAMQTVPRELFVDEGFEEFAYEDDALPIGEGQTISQPYIVALMLEAAELGPGDRALEVGAGSGYAAAVISRIVQQVYAIERHELLGEQAQQRFGQIGYDNIILRIGDGSIGWPEAGPFDAILVAASAPVEPDGLKSQLKIGGRLVMPVGGHEEVQQLVKITRTGDDAFARENLGAVRFVPLVGAEGWTESGGRRRDQENHVARGTDYPVAGKWG